VNKHTIEEEQVEALQAWWQANGRTLMAGIALAIVGVVGFQSWQLRELSRAEAASALYSEFERAIEEKQSDQTAQLGSRLLEEYGNTGYGPVTALLLAKIAAEENDDAVESHLKWVLEHSDDSALLTLAHLRLARWQLAGGNSAEAKAQLDAIPPEARSASWYDLEGDLLAASGDQAGAIAAYQQALAEGFELRVGSFNLVQMKLENLANNPVEPTDEN